MCTKEPSDLRSEHLDSMLLKPKSVHHRMLICLDQAASGWHTMSEHHPSAMRNRIPILKTLFKLLPDSDDFSGLALEVASGTGRE